jgi:hypothetical protein
LRNKAGLLTKDISAEQGSECLFDLTDGNEFDVELLAVKAGEIVFGDDDMRET